MVGTLNDGWIVGKKSDQREFFVIFDQKNANLLEINGPLFDFPCFFISLSHLSICRRSQEAQWHLL